MMNILMMDVQYIESQLIVKRNGIIYFVVIPKYSYSSFIIKIFIIPYLSFILNNLPPPNRTPQLFF